MFGALPTGDPITFREMYTKIGQKKSLRQDN